MASEVLARRILDFVADAGADDFARLALALFEHQFENLSGYRRHCLTLGAEPGSVKNWRAIPAVESSAVGNACGEPSEFRTAVSSASLPELFRSGPTWLLLVAAPEAAAANELRRLADGAPKGSFLSRDEPLDGKRLRSWLGTRQRDRLPVQIVAAGAGYLSLLGFLDRRGLKFRLPPGSAAYRVTPIESIGAASWSEPLGESLGVREAACRRIICRRGPSTPLLEEAAESSGRVQIPHWVRVTSADTERLAVLDLCSIQAPAYRIESATARREAGTTALVLG